MANNYKAEKAAKRKTGQKALWLLIVLLVVVVAMVVKIMFANDLKADGGYSGMPSKDEAYTVAKEFIKPTLKSSTANFSDSHYQAGITTDSVYTIQSSVETKGENNDKVTVNFKIRLKYHGGEPTRTKNWDVVNLDSY